MCLVIAVVLAIFAFNAMMAENTAVGLTAAAGSIFFIFLMLRNIRYVRKLRLEKERTPVKRPDEVLEKESES